jgi:hypothetical protein
LLGERSLNSRPLLGSGSVNTFPRKRNSGGIVEEKHAATEELSAAVHPEAIYWGPKRSCSQWLAVEVVSLQAVSTSQ